jgi:hypothetical protein
MKRETIEKILNFLDANEGKQMPSKWFDSVKKFELIKKLENHPDDTQYRYEDNLPLSYTNITKLPNDLYVDGWLDLENCKQITELPNKLYVRDWLDLRDCVKIKKLTDNLYVGGTLYLSGCEQLIKLPDNLSVIKLWLSECKKLTELPNNLHIKRDLHLDHTGVIELPNKLYVGDDLFINNTPLADKYTDEEIYKIVASTGGEIIGEIYR